MKYRPPPGHGVHRQWPPAGGLGGADGREEEQRLPWTARARSSTAGVGVWHLWCPRRQCRASRTAEQHCRSGHHKCHTPLDGEGKGAAAAARSYTARSPPRMLAHLRRGGRRSRERWHLVCPRLHVRGGIATTVSALNAATTAAEGSGGRPAVMSSSASRRRGWAPRRLPVATPSANHTNYPEDGRRARLAQLRAALPAR